MVRIRGLFCVLFLISVSSNGQIYDLRVGEPIQPGQFVSPVSIAQGPSGDFYVSEHFYDKIVKFTESGEFILEWNMGMSNRGLWAVPIPIAVDANENVYIIDERQSIVLKFSSTGSLLLKWGVTGSNDGELSRPTGIAIDAMGSIWISDTGNSRIQKFDADGNFLMKWGSMGYSDSELNLPGAISLDSDGNFFVIDNYRIKKFDANGVFITAWGSRGSGDGQWGGLFLNTIVVTPVGDKVYLMDIDNARVQVFDGAGTFLFKWGSRGDQNGQFAGCLGITMDATGNVYVPDFSNKRIQKFSVDGSWLGSWSNPNSLNGQYFRPVGLATDDENNLFMVENGNRRVQKFNSSGLFVSQIGSYGDANHQYLFPVAIAIYKNHLFVLDVAASAVLKFDINGNFVRRWGSFGAGEGQFKSPVAIAVDENGNVFISDTWNFRIQKFDNDGNFIMQWGSQGSGDEQFQFLSGIATDFLGNVYVVDRSMIKKFDNSGKFIMQWGGGGNVAGGPFSYVPSAIATDAAGNIIVSEGGTIHKFDAEGVQLSKWINPGNDIDQFTYIRSIGFDKEASHIYICDYTRIDKFKIISSINSLIPVSGPVGSECVILGNSFSENVEDNIVYVGGIRSPVTIAAANKLTVNVPAGATYAPLSVTINGLTSYSPIPFSVTFPGNPVVNASSFLDRFNYSTGSAAPNSQFQTINIYEGDLDGDGKSEIIATHFGEKGISILRNTGSTGVLNETSFDNAFTMASSEPMSLAIADLDGDGKLDLAAANYNPGSISIFRNTSTLGAISFAASVDLTITSKSVFGIAAADIDMDGKPDIAFTSDVSDVMFESQGAVSILKNVSTPGSLSSSSFMAAVDFVIGGTCYGLAVGDLDADSRPDIVVTSSLDSVSVLKNVVSIGSITINSFQEPVSFLTSDHPMELAIGDLNNDAMPEIAVACRNNVSLFENSTVKGSIDKSSFNPKVEFVAGNWPNDVEMGDINGDGKIDFAVANYGSRSISVFTNKNLSRDITNNSFSKFDYNTGLAGVLIADIDGDGRADLASSNYPAANSIAVLRNTVLAPDPLIPSVVARTSLETSIVLIVADNADGYILVRGEEASPTGNLIDRSIDYVAGDSFGGGIIVYNGPMASITDIGLSPNTVYHYDVYAYNGQGEFTNYSTPLEVSYATLQAEPVHQATELAFASVTINSFDVSFAVAEGTPDGYLAIRSIGTASTELPVDGTEYTVDQPLGAGTVVHRGPETFFSNSGLAAGTSYYVSIYSYNGATGTYNYLTSSPLTGGQQTLQPAEFKINSPAYDPKFSNGGKVSAEVLGARGPLAVTLLWRKIAEAEFTTAPVNLRAGTSTVYETAITNDMADELGTEFYFKADDGFGVIENPLSYFIYRSIDASSNVSIPFAAGFNGKTNTYQMFSIPYDLVETDIEKLFDVAIGKHEDTKWRLFHFQGNEYREYPNQFLDIRLGDGYWFNTKLADFQIKLGDASVVQKNQSDAFVKRLEPGWNQIGNPYPFNIDWNVVAGGNDKIGPLWFFNSGSYSKSNVFKPWTGAFVHADEAMTLAIPVLAKTTASGRISNHEMEADLDAEEWLLPIALRINDLQQVSGLGMHPQAKTSKDKFDEITVPRFLDYAEMNTYHEEFFSPRFSTDVVPTSEEQVWTFDVKSNLEDQQGELTWDHTFIAANKSSLILIDLFDGKWVDMKTTGAYSFTHREGRQFKLLYNREGEIKPGMTLLGEAYPNPFTSEVRIPLLVDEPGLKQIEIYDGFGRLIQRISADFQQRGIQEMIWNTRDVKGQEISSGMLYYRLTDSSAYKVKRLIKK